MKKFNKELLAFLPSGTTSFTCIKTIKEELLKNGYEELTENSPWSLTNTKYFIIRNDATLIAFNLPEKPENKFNIIATHCDTPSFTIKPTPEFFDAEYLKLNVAPYGGILNYGFMDRPLSIAGRLILKKNSTTYEKMIIDLKEPVAIIPSLAIHQNDAANSKLDLNTHTDLIPIISLNKKTTLKELISSKLNLKDEIFDYDLYLYNTDKPNIINDEFIASPRIDNLTCTFAALKSFLNNLGNSINVLAIFNSEEIGSNTLEGADSNFLIDTLKRICAEIGIELPEALANSIIISADNTHAKHPNHSETSDHTNTPPLNSGILITKEPNGTTQSLSSSLFRHICEKENLPCSFYTSRNDYATGSTQAGVSLKHLSINSIDIALPMLAMHSSLELIGIKDTYTLYRALTKFYQLNYEFKNNQIIIKEQNENYISINQSRD